MTETARLVIVTETQGVDKAKVSLAELEAKAKAAGESAKGLGANMKEAAAAADASSTVVVRATTEVEKFRRAQAGAAAGAKLASHELLNLSRQFSDVGVTAAMGMSPMMILVQQGPQIAETMATAAKRGVTLSGAFGQLSTEAAGLARGLAAAAAPFAPLIAAVGVAGGSAVVLARAWHDATHVSAQMTGALEDSADATGLYVKATRTAHEATADLRSMLEQDTEAARRNMEEKRKLAVANLNVAKTALAAAQVTLAANDNPSGAPSYAIAGIGLAGNAQAAAAKLNADAAVKALHEQDVALKQLQDDLSSGGRHMLEALQQQNAEFGKSRAQITMMRAETAAANPDNAAYRDSILAKAKAVAAQQRAEDARTKSLQSGRVAMNQARQAAADLKAVYGDLYGLQAQYLSGGGALQQIGEDMATLDRVAQNLAARGLPMAQAAYLQLFNAIKEGPAKIEAAGLFDLRDVVNGATEASNAWQKGMDEAASASQQAMREVDGAIDDVFNSIRNRDWAGAFGGLLAAIGQVKTGWSSMTGSDRIGAITNVAGVAGSAIGGAAGAGLMGAAAGAAGGASLAMALSMAAGPAGWVIGGAAAIGGLLGLFGDSKAKKRQKAEEEAKAAADAATLAQQTLNQARDIEAQRLALTGDALGALNLQRQAEREGIAASNLAAYDELQALRDANSLHLLNIELLKAQGQIEQATAMEHEDALKALTPAEQELTKQIWAAQAAATAAAQAEQDRAAAKAIWDDKVRDADSAIARAQSDLTAARNAETSALREQAQQAAQAAQASRDMWQGFVDGLTQFQKDLGAQAAAVGGGSYRAASSAFYANASRAQLGDKDAQGQFIALGQAFAQSSAASAKSEIQNLRDLAGIRIATEAAKATAGRQVDVQQAQLDAANAQLAALQTVNDSVLTVAQATANLTAAMAVKANLTGVGLQANDNSGFGSSSADIQRLLATGLIASDGPAAGGAGYADLLLSQYRDGQLDPGSPTYLNLKAAGFATGGSFKVGGSGGPDSKAFRLNLTPGEMVNVRRPGESTDPALLDEVKAMRQELREELAAFRREQASVPLSSKKTAEAFDRMSPDGGDSLQVKIAS